MDKLLELLNEYQEQKGSEIRFKRIDDSDFFVCWDDVWLGYETILSKKFGFIKWLVENDKIDREQKTKEFRFQIELDNWSYWELWWEARLLMLLSISNSPIEDLILYLK